MREFTIEIAHTPVEVTTLFSSTREYFKMYLTEKAPVLSIEVTPEDLIFEQEQLDEEADREHLRHRIFTDPFLERAAVQRKIADYVIRKNILLLHGSTVAVHGKAYLFTAECGVGKSTHTRLWQKKLGDQAIIVNDDRAFLQIENNTVTAFGSPWSGKHGLDSNISVPLAGICLLERGTENRIYPISKDAALPELIHQTFIPYFHCKNALEVLAESLSTNIPLWKMACTKDPEAADIAYSAMSGKSGSTASD